MQSFRDRFIQPANPASYSARARARRWKVFMAYFPELSSMKILDLGGEPKFWRAVPNRPAHVTMVNLKRSLLPPEEPWMRLVIGDACAADYPPEDYDLVVSNSVLEHVGGADQRKRFADVVHRAADRHWVQTPNRYFPIEPHWFFPAFQFLPIGARVLVTRTWPLSHRRSRDAGRAAALVREVELIGPAEMHRLFPTSEIWLERFVGLAKSIVAIGADGSSALAR